MSPSVLYPHLSFSAASSLPKHYNGWKNVSQRQRIEHAVLIIQPAHEVAYCMQEQLILASWNIQQVLSPCMVCSLGMRPPTLSKLWQSRPSCHLQCMQSSQSLETWLKENFACKEGVESVKCHSKIKLLHSTNKNPLWCIKINFKYTASFSI